MYRATFNIGFPKIEVMQKHILTRHDLVHRIGKTKDGREVVIQDIDLGTLIDDVKNFVKPIVTELKIGIDN